MVGYQSGVTTLAGRERDSKEGDQMDSCDEFMAKTGETACSGTTCCFAM